MILRMLLLLSVILSINCLVYAQDQPNIATNSSSWSLAHTFIGHTDSVHAVAFSPDGQTVASASWDASIILWDVETGAQKMVLKHGYHPHQVLFSPDGKFLYSSGGNGLIKKWNLQTGRAQILIAVKQEITQLSLSAAGDLLACDCDERAATILNTQTNKIVGVYRYGNYVHGVAISPNGKLLAVASSHKKDLPVLVWDIATKKLVQHYEGVNYAHLIAFSPDSQILAVASQSDETVKFFNPFNGQLEQTLPKDNYSFLQLVFSPNNNLLATLRSVVGMGITFYDLQKNSWQGTKLSATDIYSFAFSPDGKKIVTAGYDDKMVKIWRSPEAEEAEPKLATLKILSH